MNTGIPSGVPVLSFGELRRQTDGPNASPLRCGAYHGDPERSSTVEPGSYQEVKRVFLAARALDGPERAALLERECAADASLRREVESLLAEESGLDAFLESPATSAAAPADQPETPARPKRIERYRIDSVLGFGGMGVVYLAEQDSPKRSVALKVLRSDSASPESTTRFKREAELLGRLQHPGIARIYEAGTATTEVGTQPFFAMEYVEGRPLLEYAREKGLAPRRRLRLLSRIAEAVHYAHEQGVVHRDLKPGNVLVDRTGQPKVLDFGVARASRGRDHEAGTATAPGQLVGTLAYMSPEQAAGSAEVDARADVYSLGVILYELLTGRLPYETHGSALHEVVRRIREDDPISIASVNPAFRGDVEVIVGKALQKEPGLRYGSAAALADDVLLHLDGRPIRARPPSAGYQLRKFVQRHRSVAWSVGTAFALLAAGLVVSLVLLGRAREAESRSRYVRDTVLRLLDVPRLEGLLSEADQLWPAHPSRAPEMAAWLEDARPLAERLELHRDILRRFEAWLATPSGRELAASSPRDEELLLRVQSGLVAELAAFADPERGTLASVERRHAAARSLAERTVGRHAAAWKAALASIADPAACPAYGGLVLEPQTGLVPRGRNAAGLWEFTYHGHGAEPDEAGAHDLVLVLLPGRPEPGVEPCFLATRAVSGARWRRWVELALAPRTSERLAASASDPVASVSWLEAASALAPRRLALAVRGRARGRPGGRRRGLVRRRERRRAAGARARAFAR